MFKTFILGLCAALFLPAVYARDYTAAGNTVSFTSGPINASNIGGYAITTASDGTLILRQPVRMPLPGGGSLPLDVTDNVPRGTAGPAIARFAKKAIPLAAFAVGLAELAVELGWIYDKADAAETAMWKSPDPSTFQPDNPFTCTNVLTLPRQAGPNSPSWPAVGTFRRYGSNDTTRAVVGRVSTAQKNTLVAQGWSWMSNDGSVHGVVKNCLGPLENERVEVSQGELADKIASKSGWPTGSALGPAFEGAIKSGESVDPESTTTSGPASTSGPSSSTTTNNVTNNTTTTTTTTTTNNHTYSGPSVTTITTTVTNTTTGTTGGTQAPTETTTTTDEKPASSGTATPISPTTGKPVEPAPFEMPCGVAGTPPCAVKADETGTKQTVDELTDVDQLARDVLQPLEDLKNDPVAFWPSLPQINWSFSMPTGCGSIALPAFAPFLPEIDICPWQDLFHEIMTAVWVLGGLFGAIGTFWRNTFATV